MHRLLLASWARPSLFLANVLSIVVIVGAGNSSLATARYLPVAARAVAVPLAELAARPEVAAAAGLVAAPSATEPLLGAERYLDGIPFGDSIAAVGARYGVDPLLIAAVVEAESNFQVDAVSPKGALGLMQVMPVHVAIGIEPLDPEVNLELGAALLATLAARFDGQIELALAAYHAGPGAVERFGGVPPYRSTELYVERVLEIYLEHYSQIVAGS